MLSWIEAEEKFGQLFTIDNAARYLKMDKKLLKNALNAGLLEHFRIGIDLKGYNPRQKYAIAITSLHAFQERYKNLKEIAQKLNVGEQVLYGASSDGIISPIPGFNFLWDSEEIESKLPLFHCVPQSEYLTESQWKIIDQYIEHRSNKRAIKFMGVVCKTGFSSNERAESVRKQLARIFYRITCGRCGFTGYEKRKAGRENKYNALSAEEIAIFQENAFLVHDFSYKDIDFMNQGLKLSTQFNLSMVLKPFLIWFLKQEQLKPEHDRYESPSGFEKFQAMRDRILLAIDELPDEHPGFETSRVKVFLTRQQMVEVYKLILNCNVHDKLRAAVLFMVGCLLGLRPPSEYRKIRIDHFELDRDGFLKDVGDGYGRLNLPAHASKGGYGPSHPDLGTLVVPSLRLLLNKYLTILYQQCTQKGKGYLFRPNATNPEEQYAPGVVAPLETWVEPVRNSDCLDPGQRHIIGYDTRHTINELINSTVVSQPDLAEQKGRAAEVQLRHNIDVETGQRRYGSVGDVHYRKDIAKDVYWRIIDETLNFPWDLEKLKKWEIERGYRTAPEPEIQLPSPSVHPSSPAEELTDEQKAVAELLKQYRNEYAKLGKGRPRPMNPNDWMQRLDWLQKQISYLEISAARNF